MTTHLACRFCWHDLGDHNVIVGCPHCRCAATPGEGNPLTDADLDRVIIPPGQYAPDHQPDPGPPPVDATSLLEDTDDYRVDYDVDVTNDGDGRIHVRRTVWTKHRLRSRREIVHQETVATLSGRDAINFARDLASSLYFAKGTL